MVNKLGNTASFGFDPRRVETAGNQPFGAQQEALTATIQARYDSLKMSYEKPKSGGDVAKDSTVDSIEKESLIFFFHPDHLGSTSYVTGADGTVAQHVEYIPYGEVFVEERNGIVGTAYLFNAKELDDETGMYYYGARYLDPTGGMWISVDPMWEGKPDISGYAYCLGNSVRLTDPDGMWEKDEDGNLVAQKGDNAYTFAKYLNTDVKTSIKMLGGQGYNVNKKGILQLKEGDVFNVEHSTPTPDSREDLGFMGNQIRERAHSEFSKNIFENYWNGGGNIELSDERFASILMYVKENNPETSKPNNVTLKNNDGSTSKGVSKTVSFYGSKEYDFAFGRATLYYNSKGNIVGFYDKYDFDSKPWMQRTIKNEITTRAVRYASPSASKSFDIKYGHSKR